MRVRISHSSAEGFGIASSTVGKIVRGECWKSEMMIENRTETQLRPLIRKIVREVLIEAGILKPGNGATAGREVDHTGESRSER